MTYNKPEIVTSGSPIKAIQGTSKNTAFQQDTLVQPSDPRYLTVTESIGAYEADE